MTLEFTGRTVDVDAPFLGGEFWKPGISIRGVVGRCRQSENGTAYTLDLEVPVTIDGEEWDRVQVGNLSGFRMALQACKLPGLREKDVVELECTDIKAAKKEGYSPRPNFTLRVIRA